MFVWCFTSFLAFFQFSSHCNFTNLCFFSFLQILTLSQATNFRLFQAERVSKWQFQIWWKRQKLLQRVENIVGKGDIAHCEQFLLSHNVFKRLLLQTCENQGLFGKGLKATGFSPYNHPQNNDHLWKGNEVCHNADHQHITSPKQSLLKTLCEKVKMLDKLPAFSFLHTRFSTIQNEISISVLNLFWCRQVVSIYECGFLWILKQG